MRVPNSLSLIENHPRMNYDGLSLSLSLVYAGDESARYFYTLSFTRLFHLVVKRTRVEEENDNEEERGRVGALFTAFFLRTFQAALCNRQ